MTRTADVVVIGGGIHGCSTALHLALRGLKPILVEKDYAGRHASGVNAGGVRQLARDLAEIPLSISSSESTCPPTRCLTLSNAPGNCPTLIAGKDVAFPLMGYALMTVLNTSAL